MKEDYNQEIRRKLYIQEKEERAIKRNIKTSEEYKRLEEEIKRTKKEIKSIQFKFIEILAIFVTIIGFLFGFISFSNSPQLNFLQTIITLSLFAMILYGFIWIIHKLFS